MVEVTRQQWAALRGIYEAVAIVPTSTTSPQLLELLSGAIVQQLEASNGSIGVGRRHALQLGLETGATHLHYCDFDRILHWIGRYPDELLSVVESIPQYDYLILGRTERAFATHPRVQRDTETITNHAFSLWLGQQVDISAGSCGVSRRGARLLLASSTAPTNATDAEWPAIVRMMQGGRVGHAETEGLEFETPDYFQDEIARVGSLEAWLDERSKPLSSWIVRTRLTMESLESTLRVIQASG